MAWPPGCTVRNVHLTLEVVFRAFGRRWFDTLGLPFSLSVLFSFTFTFTFAFAISFSFSFLVSFSFSFFFFLFFSFSFTFAFAFTLPFALLLTVSLLPLALFPGHGRADSAAWTSRGSDKLGVKLVLVHILFLDMWGSESENGEFLAGRETRADYCRGRWGIGRLGLEVMGNGSRGSEVDGTVAVVSLVSRIAVNVVSVSGPVAVTGAVVGVGESGIRGDGRDGRT